MTPENFDVIIVGAGPAGCACALSLAGSGLKIAIIDKAKTPTSKICGDALSHDVINQLDKLPSCVKDSFDKIEEKIKSSGVRFYSPKNECLEISFEREGKKQLSGYVCKRKYFDQVLIDSVKKFSEISLFEECEIRDIMVNAEEVVLLGNQKSFTAKIVVGADGVNSVVAKKLSEIKNDKKALCLGLRGYYENMTGFHPENFIELHFNEIVLPGYIWLFPMANNIANVGIGMLAADVSEKKVNLKSLLENYITSHPNISPRFKDATQTGKFEAWTIPLGIKKNIISGDRFLLAGDAASLVDPFTGEGVGNALRSGRVASDHIKTCFLKNRFSGKYNLAYDEEIYRRMWKELKLSKRIQKLSKSPGLINAAISKANRNVQLKDFIADAMQNVDVKKRFLKPYLFYKTFIH